MTPQNSKMLTMLVENLCSTDRVLTSIAPAACIVHELEEILDAMKIHPSDRHIAVLMRMQESIVEERNHAFSEIVAMPPAEKP